MGVVVVINADDLGYSDQRNAGILRCSRAVNGVVTACSLLVNGAAAHDALAQFEHITEKVSLGLHLNLTEGKPLSSPELVPSLLKDGLFLGKMGFREALAAGLVNMDEVAMEISAQLSWFVRHVGKTPSHADGHQHVHVLPGVCQVFARLLQQHGVRWTRYPTEKQLSSCLWVDEKRRNFYKGVMTDAEKARASFDAHSVRYPHCFVGLSTSGSDQTLERLITGIQHEVSEVESRDSIICEVMVHPGDTTPAGQGGCGDGPDAFAQSADREHESAILSSHLLREKLDQAGWTLRAWSEL